MTEVSLLTDIKEEEISSSSSFLGSDTGKRAGALPGC